MYSLYTTDRTQVSSVTPALPPVPVPSIYLPVSAVRDPSSNTSLLHHPCGRVVEAPSCSVAAFHFCACVWACEVIRVRVVGTVGKSQASVRRSVALLLADAGVRRCVAGLLWAFSGVNPRGARDGGKDGERPRSATSASTAASPESIPRCESVRVRSQENRRVFATPHHGHFEKAGGLALDQGHGHPAQMDAASAPQEGSAGHIGHMGTHPGGCAQCLRDIGAPS